MNYKSNEWRLILVCTLMILVSVGVGTATFSIYLPYFIKVHGFTNTQTSFLVSLRTMSSFFCMLLVTWYFNRLSLRTGMTVAMVGCAAAFVLLGCTGNYYLNCAAVALLGGAYTFASMYPLTILMNQWFGDKSGIPLSISSCGSGFAAIFCPTVITYIMDTYGLSAGFFTDAILSLLVAVLIYVYVRDYPEDNEYSYIHGRKNAVAHRFREISPLHFKALMLAVIFNGSLTLAGWGHFAILFKTHNYTSMQVAFALSMGGLTLTTSKFFYGFITERIKTFKSNFLFCTLINIGFLLCLLLPLGYGWVPGTIAVFTGLGCPISTLGIAMWTKEVSSPKHFPQNLKTLQTCHQLGGLIFANAPGMLADLTGSYLPSYMLFSCLGLISFVIIQSIYAKNKLYEIYNEE